MSGELAIFLKDLPAALKSHAEYEPIIPHPSHDSVKVRSVRQGRSAPKVRVSASVIPQAHLRPKVSEGKKVLVTSGTYKGLFGKISSSLPGGWVMVSGLKDFDLDIVMKSSQLELIPDNPKRNATQTLSHNVQSKIATDKTKTNFNLVDTLNEMIDEHLRYVFRFLRFFRSSCKIRCD
jgi:hypothetical protein